MKKWAKESLVGLIAAGLLAFASVGMPADAPMPWASVNGSANGYSIKLESA